MSDCQETTKRKRCWKLDSSATHTELLSNSAHISNNEDSFHPQTSVTFKSTPNRFYKVRQSDTVINSTVEVTFRVPFQVEGNERIVLCGNTLEFGNWQPCNAFPLTRTQGDIWTGKLRLRSGKYELKCIRVAGDCVDWEDGNNRILQIEETQSPGSKMQVTMEFNETRFSDTVKTVRETIFLDADGSEQYLVTGEVHKLARIEPVVVMSIDSESHKECTTAAQSEEISPEVSVQTPNEIFIKEYFQSVLCFTEEDLNSLFSQYTELRLKFVASNVKSVVEFLHDKIGASYREIGLLIKKTPRLLELSIEDELAPAVDIFLSDVGVTCSQLLEFLEESQLSEFLGESQNQITLTSPKETSRSKFKNLKNRTQLNDFEIRQLLTGNGASLSPPKNRFYTRFENLKAQLNLDTDECSDLVVKCAKAICLGAENVSETVNYLTQVQNRTASEIVNYPGCLSLSVEKRMKKRFKELEKAGLNSSLYTLSKIIGSSDITFNAFLHQEMKKKEDNYEKADHFNDLVHGP